MCVPDVGKRYRLKKLRSMEQVHDHDSMNVQNKLTVHVGRRFTDLEHVKNYDERECKLLSLRRV